MPHFKLITPQLISIAFNCYETDAPRTTEAFLALLPLTRVFMHARYSGMEIWFDNLPELHVIQENASIHTQPGEVVLGPAKPQRTKTANCFGIYYGEGTGIDACNIFAKVVPEDFEKLKQLGEQIWKEGSMEITLTQN